MDRFIGEATDAQHLQKGISGNGLEPVSVAGSRTFDETAQSWHSADSTLAQQNSTAFTALPAPQGTR